MNICSEECAYSTRAWPEGVRSAVVILSHSLEAPLTTPIHLHSNIALNLTGAAELVCCKAVSWPLLEILRLAAARTAGSEVLPSQPVSKPEYSRCKQGTEWNRAENAPGHVAVTVEGGWS